MELSNVLSTVFYTIIGINLILTHILLDRFVFNTKPNLFGGWCLSILIVYNKDLLTIDEDY